MMEREIEREGDKGDERNKYQSSRGRDGMGWRLVRLSISILPFVFEFRALNLYCSTVLLYTYLSIYACISVYTWLLSE